MLRNRTNHEKFLRAENRTRCRFSQYALLFKDLVCCEHDVQLLKDRGVLRVKDGDERRSNEDLMTHRKISNGIEIDASSWDGRFGQLINDLNAFSGAREIVESYGFIADALQQASGTRSKTCL